MAGPHRSRRRSDPAGPHRPRAARRVRPDQRNPDGGLLRRRPRHGHVARPGSTADLPRARPSTRPGHPGGLHRLWCCSAARRLRRRVPGGAADPGAGRSPRLRARHLPGARVFRSVQLLGRADRKQCPCRSASKGGTDRGGDLANAGYTYYASVPGLLDCAPSLDRYLTEADAAVAFVRRTGSERPSRCSTPTGGWPVCCAATARPQRVRRFPSTGTPRQPAGASLRAYRPCDRRRDLRRSDRLGAAHRGGDAAASGGPRSLPDRRGPPVARAGPGRPGPRRRWRRARRPAGRVGRGDPVAGCPRRGRAG